MVKIFQLNSGRNVFPLNFYLKLYMEKLLINVQTEYKTLWLPVSLGRGTNQKWFKYGFQGSIVFHILKKDGVLI